MRIDAASVSADRIWHTSFPFWAPRRVRGFALVATDTPSRAGSGIRVEGPPAALLLVTGRPAALTDLTGPAVSPRVGIPTTDTSSTKELS